ncbi:hypothetical protein [Marinifilum flexuosum]|uniref:WD40 repeat protein n=1 Tax=Marinifilum flexuosum TaxID=1117708 RepID=A0A419WF56_9BACT|nr:hypothetical protein [Marinifilum flexuosum]RKD94097.1 hypothetical protein BXY64_4260 [Marinifilum flexuosum]
MNKLKFFLVVLIALFCVNTLFANKHNANYPDNNSIASADEQVNIGSNIYTLQRNEEFVYGKIGKNNNGGIKYTVAVVRVPNAEKEVYEFYGPYYGPRPIGANLRKARTPKEYNKYDYYLIFNGNKMGPYDHIYSLDRDPDIDKWVSEDGNRISFCGTRKNKYYPIIGNNKAFYYWGPSQAPEYDTYTGKYAFSIQWSQNDYRIYENGMNIIKGAKMVSEPVYSRSGRLLYASAPEKRDEMYVYVDHQQKFGPFKMIAHKGIGFITGTEQVFYNTYQQVRCGEYVYNCKPNESLNQFSVSSDYVVFCAKDTKTQNNTVYEYNVANKTVKKHGPYKGNLYVKEAGNQFYYRHYNTQTERYQYLGMGGKILWNKNHLTGIDGLVFSRMSDTNDLYVSYVGTDKKTHVDKNGKDMQINKNIANVNTLQPQDNEVLIHLNVDAKVAATKHEIIYKQNKLFVHGDLDAGQIFTLKNTSDLFYTLRIKKGQNHKWKLYRNNQLVNDVEYSDIKEFQASPDGSTYAYIDGGRYIIENRSMDFSKKVYLNGKALQGKYGAPIWSEKYNAMLSIKQKGNQLVVSEL